MINIEDDIFSTISLLPQIKKQEKIKKSKNGINFENKIKMIMKREYNFISSRYRGSYKVTNEEDMFNMFPLNKRILWEKVPFTPIINFLGAEIDAETEFVLQASDALFTEEFTEEDFDDDGILRVRIEGKYQEKDGSAYKKNPSCINDIKYGAPEKNAIFLVDGSFYSSSHRKELLWYCSEKGDLVGMKDQKRTKVILMNLEDFINWCERAFITKGIIE